jgi:hypothetical protein
MTTQRELDILHTLKNWYGAICKETNGQDEEAAVALEAIRERIATVELNALHEAELER